MTRRSSWPDALTTTSRSGKCLYRRPFAIWAPATLDERTANAYELREVAERLGDRTFRLGTARNLVLAAACRGDLAEVDQNLDVMIRLAAETGVAEARWAAALTSGVATTARRAYRRSRTGCGRGAPDRKSGRGAQRATLYYGPQLYAIRRAQGRLDEMIEPFERAVVRESRGGPVSRGSPRRAVRSRPTRRRSSGLRAACRQPFHRLPLR